MPAGQYGVNRPKNTRCQIDGFINWMKVEKHDSNDIAPLLIASFDIECGSSHGDFPVAKKNYKKLAYDVVMEYVKIEKEFEKQKNDENNLINNINEQNNLLRKLIMLSFTDSTEDQNINNISKVYPKRKN